MLRKLAAGVSVIATIYALVYGPLFHVHPLGEHEHGSALVHAHFEEFDLSPEPFGPAFEHPHSRSHQIDLLTSDFSPNFSDLAALGGDVLPIIPTELKREFIVAVECRAHDPPAIASAVPRAPPSV
jgi:hypothetical protein